MAPRILIIDDNADVRWMLCSLLESQGYECVKAPNAITALTMVEENPFDVILTDYKMPRMNGLELIEKLSTLPSASKIPVIMLSAMLDPQLAKQARQAGAQATLAKPINFEELLLTVARAIKDSQTRKSEHCHCS